MNNFAKEDIDSKGIEFKLIDINAFYEEGDNCNIDKLKEKIAYGSCPTSLVYRSITYHNSSEASFNFQTNYHF